MKGGTSCDLRHLRTVHEEGRHWCHGRLSVRWHRGIVPRERRRLTPDIAEQWWRIGRYVGNWFVGAALLIYSTVFAHPANPAVVGAGLALMIGYPALQMLKSIAHSDPPEEKEKP